MFHFKQFPRLYKYRGRKRDAAAAAAAVLHSNRPNTFLKATSPAP
jgi:hypothetical protein